MVNDTKSIWVRDPGISRDEFCQNFTWSWKGALPELEAPTVRFSGRAGIDQVTLDWQTTFPIAHVLGVLTGTSRDELRVELTGAVTSFSGAYFPKEDIPTGIHGVEVRGSQNGRAPHVRVQRDEGELWGYGFSMPDALTLRLTIWIAAPAGRYVAQSSARRLTPGKRLAVCVRWRLVRRQGNRASQPCITMRCSGRPTRW